ncbi:MAG: hypothetical protein ACSLFQ_07300, partial [Thermoanaerobaculia bacterium]
HSPLIHSPLIHSEKPDVQRSRLSLFALAALCATAPLASADRLITKDGRVLSCKKARPEGAGYKVVFENGEILVPDKTLVQSVEVEGDMSDYVPANDDEKKKLADGYVKYQGKWLMKPAFELELKRNYEKSKKRLEEIAAHADFDSGWTKETAHFRFQSNTSPELLNYYCELLEAYYDLQDQRIGINPTPTMKRTKMQVNVYRSHEDFQANAPWGNEGSSPSVLGFFSPMGQNLNFYHDYEDPAQSTWVALHECTHLLTHLIDQDYIAQIWLNEGVADYFGSSKVERDKKGKLVIKPGEIQLDRVLTVQQAIKEGATSTGGGDPGAKRSKGVEGQPDIKLEKLFKIPRDEFTGFEYAHGWSFVYFLNNFDNHKYQKNFDKFFKGLYTLESGIPFEVVNYATKTGTGKRVSPENIRAYLLKKLGLKDTEQLEKDWKKFIADIPIVGPEARLKRGLQNFYRGDLEQAIEDLDAAIEAKVTDPRAWYARGRARVYQSRSKANFEAGVKDLGDAVAMDPLNPTYRHVYSRMIAGVNGHGGDEQDIDLPEAKIQAGLAAELEPENDAFQKWFLQFK